MKNKKKKINKTVRVFVSGCYDILHAGHIQFFKDARELGDHLTVCFASDDVLRMYKNRESSMPEDNKAMLIGAIRYVDKVVKSSNLHHIFDFADYLVSEKPDILVVTEDDNHKVEKKKFCEKNGIKFVVLPKRNAVTPVSTTLIRKKLSKAKTV